MKCFEAEHESAPLLVEDEQAQIERAGERLNREVVRPHALHGALDFRRRAGLASAACGNNKQQHRNVELQTRGKKYAEVEVDGPFQTITRRASKLEPNTSAIADGKAHLEL